MEEKKVRKTYGKWPIFWPIFSNLKIVQIFDLINEYKMQMLAILASVGLYLYLIFLRNNWYADFYQAIDKKSGITFSILTFLVLSAIIAGNDAFRRFVKNVFILKSREKNLIFNNLEIRKIQYDFSQRFSEDTKLRAQNFGNFVEFFTIGLGSILIFIPRLFSIAHLYAFLVLAILAVYVTIVFALNFGYLKKLIQNSTYFWEEKEASFRKFLLQWVSKKCVRPLTFDRKQFENAQKSLRRYFFVDNLIQTLRNLSDSVGLIIPFALFYALYSRGSVSLAVMFQLVNIWVLINYGFLQIVEAIQFYINYEVANRRICEMNLKSSENVGFERDLIGFGGVNFERAGGVCGDEKKAFFDDNNEKKQVILIENLVIKNQKCKLFENFDLEIFSGQKVNIVGQNARGKTTLMQTMQGFHDYEGKILISEKIFWIPEQPIVPDGLILPQNDGFLEVCKEFEIDSNLDFSSASGGQKWRLLAAFSTFFPMVIWDDPFWGLNADLMLEKLLPKLGTCVIFSANQAEFFRKNASENIRTIFL